MNSPGVYNTGNFTVTGAGTQNGDAVTNLEGMVSCSLYLKFDYGSGGTAAKFYLQTSLDQGTTWMDIACVLFNTADEVRILNLIDAAVAQTTPTDGELSDDTVLNGVLGDRLRGKLITTGTYAGSTTLISRVCVR